MIWLYKFIKPFARWLLLIWIIIIIVFSSLPSLPEAKLEAGDVKIKLDYLLHFLEYLALASLCIMTFAGSFTQLKGKRIYIITLALVIFATADETHQLLIPSRSFNYFDLLSNLLGILCGIAITIWFNRKALQD